jgi:hypothetical protein
MQPDGERRTFEVRQQQQALHRQVMLNTFQRSYLLVQVNSKDRGRVDLSSDALA